MPNPALLSPNDQPLKISKAWDIVREFATSDRMSLPDAEQALEELLGAQLVAADWSAALDAAMLAEGDVNAALEGIEKLASVHSPSLSALATLPPQPKRRNRLTQLQPLAETPQRSATEADVMKSVASLKQRNRIFGREPTVDKFVDPIEEREIGDSPYRYEGGDAEIVEEVQYEMAVERGDIIKVDSDEDSDEEDPSMTNAEVISLCGKLEAMCIAKGDPNTSLVLMGSLHKLRGQLRHEELANTKQTDITDYFCWLWEYLNILIYFQFINKSNIYSCINLIMHPSRSRPTCMHYEIVDCTLC